MKGKNISPYYKLKPKIRQPYTIIYLVRHCNPDYATEKLLGEHNMPLSVIGKAQRRYLTKRFKNKPLDAIYASELLRAQETAWPTVKAQKKELIIESRLNEIDWKDWYRIKYFQMSEDRRKETFKNYKKLNAQLDKMQTTGRRLLHDIYKQNKGKTVALFSHGNLIKSIITSVLSADIIGFLSLEIYQSSVSKLVVDRDGYVKINYINSVSHLPHEPNEDLFITLVD